MPELPFEKLADSCTTGIMYCNRDGIVEFINKTYANHAGHPVEDIIGRSILEIFPKSPALEVMERGKKNTTFKQHLNSAKSRALQVVRTPVFKDDHVIGLLTEATFVTPRHVKSLYKRINGLKQKLDEYKNQIPNQFSIEVSIENIIGESPEIQFARESIQSFAATDFPVMVLGETGVGKELFAQTLHSSSKRSSGPFISVNCSSIPLDLFEAEMFGYKSGAFTGARAKGKLGLFQLANKGTLFLDEIAETPLFAQKKLLRVLEEKVVRPVGGIRRQPLDFRLVVATNQDLKEMVDQGLFRKDLFYRISTLMLEIPPLSKRASDIPLLIHGLSQKILGYQLEVTDEAITILQQYYWPGNIRQLRNVIAYMSLNSVDNVAGVQNIPPEILRSVERRKEGYGYSVQEFKETVQQEREQKLVEQRSSGFRLAEKVNSTTAAGINEAIERCGGNMSLAAKMLGISRSGLYVKCKKLGISRHRRGA
ncbi:MAG: sigma 54-interacting transcriptional regulator [Desulfovibrionales bacterium]|nr:sigma 54-interacting transcriptional regulator [Desulfovibrionales bacterium]